MLSGGSGAAMAAALGPALTYLLFAISLVRPGNVHQ